MFETSPDATSPAAASPDAASPDAATLKPPRCHSFVCVCVCLCVCVRVVYICIYNMNKIVGTSYHTHAHIGAVRQPSHLSYASSQYGLISLSTFAKQLCVAGEHLSVEKAC